MKRCGFNFCLLSKNLLQNFAFLLEFINSSSRSHYNFTAEQRRPQLSQESTQSLPSFVFRLVNIISPLPVWSLSTSATMPGAHSECQPFIHLLSALAHLHFCFSIIFMTFFHFSFFYFIHVDLLSLFPTLASPQLFVHFCIYSTLI